MHHKDYNCNTKYLPMECKKADSCRYLECHVTLSVFDNYCDISIIMT